MGRRNLELERSLATTYLLTYIEFFRSIYDVLAHSKGITFFAVFSVFLQQLMFLTVNTSTQAPGVELDALLRQFQ